MFSTSSKKSRAHGRDAPSRQASTSTVASAEDQAAALAMLQYQEALIRDFWSGSAAGRLPPPPQPAPSRKSNASPANSTNSSEISLDATASKKTKWGSALKDRDPARARSSRDSSPEQEPKSLSKRMFTFGFLCPLLWLVGAVFLFRPPAPRAFLAALPLHSPDECERRVAAYRAVEEKWSKRCLWAWVLFVCVVVVVVPGAVMAGRRA